MQLLLSGLTLLASWYFVLPVQYGGRTTLIAVNGVSMQPTYHTSDLVIARKTGHYKVRDIVVYKVDVGNGKTGNIVHRIVGGNATDGWVIRGDNRTTDDQWHPKNDQILGKAVLHIPGFWAYLRLMGTPQALGAITGICVLLILWPSRDEILHGRHRRKDQKDGEEPPPVGTFPKHARVIDVELPRPRAEQLVRIVEVPAPAGPDRVLRLPAEPEPERVVRLTEETTPTGASGSPAETSTSSQ